MQGVAVGFITSQQNSPGDRGCSSKCRADEGNRTPNLLITNQLLCQLSYVSECLKEADLLSKKQAPVRVSSLA
jgi:hypothetical protein